MDASRNVARQPEKNSTSKTGGILARNIFHVRKSSEKSFLQKKILE